MKSPLAYLGGKSRLTGTIVPIIRKVSHTCYCEPFCGACWVLFAKPEECSACEVINDLDGELIRFWRCVQRHYIPLLDLFRHAIVSREMFDWLKIERPRLDVEGMADDLLAVHRRLARVTVEHLDGLDCILRYDRPATLFFIDPPYIETTGYAVPFPAARYAELATALLALKGKFILTLNDHPEARRIFARFNLAETSTLYSVGGPRKQKRVGELLIRNF